MRKLILLIAVVLACSIGAFAVEYHDLEDIVNKEAVNMLSDLGVISGYEDGTFRPDNTLSREEMVTVIANLSTEEKFEATVDSFTDTTNSWARNSIEYCVEQGIVNGSSELFRTKDKVTGYELVKMLLVLLGHDNITFVGSDWKENVLEVAKKEGLMGGFIGDLNLYISRDKAAFLLNNALQCHVVSGYLEDGTVQYIMDTMRNPIAFLEIRFGAKLVNGVLLANNQYDFRVEPLEMEANTIHIDGYAKDFMVSEEIANNNDLLGHKITVYAIIGKDYNRIVGTVKPYTNEVIWPVFESYEDLEMLLQRTTITLAEDVKFVVNCQIVPWEQVEEEKNTIETIQMVDHENDSIFDYVFVTLQQSQVPAES